MRDLFINFGIKADIYVQLQITKAVEKWTKTIEFLYVCYERTILCIYM